jgi:transposase InsO family protein
VSDGLPIEVTCRIVGVSVSGFYMWKHRKPSARSVRHAMVAEVIRQVHAESRQTYGARRVHAELVLGRQMTVARCTVELVMRRLNLAGLPGRPRYRKIPKTPTATDLVNRDFARTEPNGLWLTDITEHRTREGEVYCAVVLDAFSRRIVGWSIDSSQTASLVVNAFGMAIENRQSEGVVIHSDHGTQGPIHVVGVHPPSTRLRARSIDGLHRRLLRQRPDGVVLGADAGRAVEPEAMEHPPRVGKCDLRVP